MITWKPRICPEVVLATKKNSCSGREERRVVTSGEEGKAWTCEGEEGWERSSKEERRERERERKREGGIGR